MTTTMSTLEKNKQLAADFLAAISAFDWQRLDSLLDESFTWWVNGSLPISGPHTKQQTLELLRSLASGVRVSPEHTLYTPTGFTAEDNRVAVEMKAYCEMLNGKIYDGRYHLLFEIRDGSIVEMRDYLDTMHAFDCFFSDQNDSVSA